MTRKQTKAGLQSVRLLKRIGVGAVVLTVSIGALARPLGRISDSEMNIRLRDFAALPWNGKTTMADLKQDWTCLQSKQSIDVEDPQTRAIKTYWIEYRHPVNTKVPVPLVILVPTILGTGIVEHQVADTLCNNGIGTMIADVNDVHQPTTFPSWGIEDINDRQAGLALQTVIDYARHNMDIDANNIGMMGLSMGAITTSMMAGVLGSNLKAYVTVVGAGNMPHTLTYSDEGTVTTLRDNRMRSQGWHDLTQYENKMRETMKYDPIYFASRVPKENVLMIMASGDTKVPYIVQKETFEAFGQPHQILFSGGHSDTIAQVAYLYMDKVTQFFRDKFGFHAKVHFDKEHMLRQQVILN